MGNKYWQTHQGNGGRVEGVATIMNLPHGAEQADTLLVGCRRNLINVFGVFSVNTLGGEPHAIPEADHPWRDDGVLRVGVGADGGG